MEKKIKQHKNGKCYKTRNKKIKSKYQIKVELISKTIMNEHEDIKQYNKYLEEETNKIYEQQFKQGMKNY